MRHVLLLALTITIGSHFGFLQAANWDVEYWQFINWNNWEKGPYKIYTSGAVRFNEDISKYYYGRATINFAYKVNPCLTVEAHYSYFNVKNRGSLHFIKNHRLELEYNPSLTFSNGIILRSRNRFEIVKQEPSYPFNYILRQRLMVAFPISNFGKLVSIDFSDELFYNFNSHKFNQNRLIPIRLTYALNRHTSLNVFVMIRHFFSDQWYRSVVLGSELSF